MEELVAGSVVFDEDPDGTALGDGRKDWLAVAINQAGGRSALSLIRLLSSRVKQGERLTQLPDPYRSTFQRFIKDESLTASHGRIVLSSQAHFLFAIDPEWTRRFLVPVFDWSIDELRAEQAWDGYTHWGRWNDALLSELMPSLREAFRRLPGSLEYLTDTLRISAMSISDFGPKRSRVSGQGDQTFRVKAIIA